MRRVIEAVRAKHGRLWGDSSLLATLAVRMTMNQAGSNLIGQLIEPLVEEGVKREGYRKLTPQLAPVIMNTKGASASGKSTLRPLHRELADSLNLDWRDFALISPDTWRKYLLDYESLGKHYKYAGTCTGHELRIIDQKLDRHIARKAERGEVSHLLIDRFRFDSFAPDSDQAGSNLLTRFGSLVYLFFMITPPPALVERAWNRGLEVGRFKAVDDVLHHAVEAYQGMPELFFTWATRSDKKVHYEFLDNDVPRGTRPRTVAFGWNGELTVVDVGALIDVVRFQRINIDATSPASVYQSTSSDDSGRFGFLAQCISRLPKVTLVDAYVTFEHGVARAYARVELDAAQREPFNPSGPGILGS